MAQGPTSDADRLHQTGVRRLRGRRVKRGRRPDNTASSLQGEGGSASGHGKQDTGRARKRGRGSASSFKGVRSGLYRSRGGVGAAGDAAKAASRAPSPKRQRPCRNRHSARCGPMVGQIARLGAPLTDTNITEYLFQHDIIYSRTLQGA